MELAHAFGTPRFRTSRYAANLIFAPSESWEFGVEAGFLDTKIDLDGVLGIATTGSLTGRTAFVWAKRTF